MGGSRLSTSKELCHREQQWIAVVLATVSHRSFSKLDIAKAAPRGQNAGTSTKGTAAAEYFTISDEEGELAVERR